MADTPAPRPVGPVRPRVVVAPEPPVPTTDPHLFGRIGPQGEIFLTTPDGEVQIAQWAAGDPEDGLAFYGRKYDDLVADASLALLRARDGRATAEQSATALTRIREALAAPAFVGDVAALGGICDQLEGAIGEAREVQARRREEQKAAAVAAREAIVDEAESLAASTQWRATGDRFAELLVAWQQAPRVDRGREQDLWKRFSNARASFERQRRQHFSQLDAQRKEARAVKEQILEEAEALAATTDWAAGTRGYRALMDRWKAAGRLAKGEDDTMWTRFRAAQDRFFTARDAVNEERSAGERENLVAKEALLAEAEALLPVKDIRSAKAALRGIQERWERAGHVPRADKERIEGRLRRVEEEVRKAESDQWRRSNPETRARAEDTTAKFEAAIERLQRQRDEAVARGDSSGAARLEESIASSRALLDAARSALADFRR